MNANQPEEHATSASEQPEAQRNLTSMLATDLNEIAVSAVNFAVGLKLGQHIGKQDKGGPDGGQPPPQSGGGEPTKSAS
jgi:hypothetical protein